MHNIALTHWSVHTNAKWKNKFLSALTQLLILRHESNMKLFELLEKYLQLVDSWKNCHSAQKDKQDRTAKQNTRPFTKQVTLRRARLVLGWVTICKRVHTAGQLSLAIPPLVGTMSTSESWEVNRHTV